MSATDTANLSLLVSRNTAREAFRLALRLYVGRGRRYSVKQLSNASGVPDRLIESFIALVDSPDYRPPCLEHVLSLASVLGPEFTCEWLGKAGQGAFWLPDEQDVPPGALAADAAEDTATIVRAAVDGRFTPDEKPELRVVGARMMARGAHLHAIAKVA